MEFRRIHCGQRHAAHEGAMMFSKLKLWIAGIIAGFFTVLVGLLQYTRHQRDKAVATKEKVEREIEEQTEIANTQSELNRVQNKAREEAAKHEPTKTDKRPTGSYGDKRLR